MHINHLQHHRTATSTLEDLFARNGLTPSFVLEQTEGEGFVATDLIRHDIYRLGKELDIVRHLYADDETTRATLHYTVEGVYPGTRGGRHHMRDVCTKDNDYNPLVLPDDTLRLKPQTAPVAHHATFDAAFRHAAWLLLFFRYRHVHLICAADSTCVIHHEKDINVHFDIDPERHLVLRLTYDINKDIIRSRRLILEMAFIESTDDNVTITLPTNND